MLAGGSLAREVYRGSGSSRRALIHWYGATARILQYFIENWAYAGRRQVKSDQTKGFERAKSVPVICINDLQGRCPSIFVVLRAHRKCSGFPMKASFPSLPEFMPVTDLLTMY